MINKLTNRVQTVRSQQGKPINAEEGGAIISEVFSDFVRSYASKLDFRSVSVCGKSYARLGMPTISIRESLQMALLSRNETHQHWVKPTSNSIDQRNHLFCAGYINIDQEMSGIRHLRIERGNIAYLWICNQTV